MKKKTRKSGERAGNAVQRREKLAQLLRTIGLWGIKRQASNLAEEFNVSRQQIQQDIQTILKGIKPEDHDKIVINLRIGWERAEEECQKILASSSDENRRLHAARTLMQIQKDRTELMERWGMKEKIADKVEHSGNAFSGITVNIVQPKKKKKKEKK